MDKSLSKFIVYPIKDYSLRWAERMMIGMNSGGGYCPVCGGITVFVKVSEDNLRESCFCLRCRSNNRKRQLAYVVCQSLSGINRGKIKSLRDVGRLYDISIYNTEPGGAIHDILSASPNYRFSGYFGVEYKSGEIVGGIEHQDLMDLSFQDESFDIVISADVFEHIPDTYLAHREVYRVLKPGGKHIFSVPFYQTEYLDEDRCIIENGKEIHIKEPIYHDDPLAMVYKIFSLEMFCKLKQIGFSTNLYRLYKPSYGIIGNNGLIFEAIKGNL